MYIAIDDTYSKTEQDSKYVTGDRKTHVAVIFNDDEVKYIHEQMKLCLKECSDILGKTVNEFHFNEIYNKRGVWKDAENEFNLDVFETFAKIYRTCNWPVEIQTIDNHTFEEHGVILRGKTKEFDLEKKDDQSLLFLIYKIKLKYQDNLTIFVDEGKKKKGSDFGKEIFNNWPYEYNGRYVSSIDEPLVQIADFLAFSINRCIHLSLKKELSDYDIWFLELVNSMNINCPDFELFERNEDSTINDFDKWHESTHRKIKGLKNL